MIGGSGISFGELTKLAASNAGSFDRFGQSVAMTDDYLIVGAHSEDTGASSAGSVYVYDKDTYAYVRTLNASDPGLNHHFGWSLAAEGNHVLVGAPGNVAGAAYLFNLDTGTQVHKFVSTDGASGDQFGHSVSLSSTHVLVGAWLVDNNDLDPSENSGAAYLFNRTTFAELYRLQSSDIEDADQFGGSVALAGNTACIGSLFDNHSSEADAGSVYVFDPNTGNEVRKIISQNPQEGDIFGAAIAAKGDLLVVGASEADAQGDTSGAAYLFEISTGNWVSNLLPVGGGAQQRIGNSVAIADKIVVGAFRTVVSGLNDAGVAHVFTTSGSYESTQVASDANTGDFFGHSIAAADGFSIIGAWLNDDGGVSSGSAYLFSTEAPPKLENLTISISGTNVILDWDATADVTYGIYLSSDLDSWPATPSFTATPTTSSASYTHYSGASLGKQYYRVGID